MKKRKVLCAISSILVVFLSFASSLSAQKFEVIPFTGYQTSARINAYEGHFRISDGLVYGGSFNFGSGSGYKMEVSYSRMASSLTYYLNNTTEHISDIAVTYLSIGGLVQFLHGDPVEPFFKIALGATYYTPSDTAVDKENVMHFSFSGGAKIYISDHIGFRFQACLNLPLFFEGMYFQEAQPAEGQGMKTKVNGVQGDFTGGVIFRF
jgi:hypothetical protein